MGYYQAGFDVTGIDNKPQPKYPFKFIQDDAIEYLKRHGYQFDFIHASPPCQAYSSVTPKNHRENYPKLIPKLRQLLVETGVPFVIENVAGAKEELHKPIMLCGTMFGLKTYRHRFFECSFEVKINIKCNHKELPLLVTTASQGSRRLRKRLGIKPIKSVRYATDAYGIDWMNFEGLRESIPPAYTEFIGKQFIKQLGV